MSYKILAEAPFSRALDINLNQASINNPSAPVTSYKLLGDAPFSRASDILPTTPFSNNPSALPSYKTLAEAPFSRRASDIIPSPAFLNGLSSTTSYKILPGAPSSRTSGTSRTIQWFKSNPLLAVGPFALQLETQSPDATKNGRPNVLFQVVVFADSVAETPLRTYYSHCNESLSTVSGNDVWQFGSIFYPNHPLLQDLKVGNVIGAQIVLSGSSRFSSQIRGRLVTRSLAGLLPLTEHLGWSLRDSPDEGVYTFASYGSCQVRASGSEPASRVWFKTPHLSEDIISRLDGIQLFTSARHQNHVNNSNQGVWSWFEIAVFEDETKTTTNVSINSSGQPNVALSHKIVPAEAADPRYPQNQEGKLFAREETFLSNLQAGNALGVRVCARYAGWENNASGGRLIISLSPRKTKPLPPNEEKMKNFTLQLLQMVMLYDKDVLKGVLKELEVAVLSKE